MAEGKLELIKGDFIEGRKHVSQKDGVSTAFNVFGNLILPFIDLTKMDEERTAREKGWIDIMKLSWFCHSPIDGKLCGLCSPCDDAMNTGMEWRIPLESQRRYRHKNMYRFLEKMKVVLNRK